MNDVNSKRRDRAVGALAGLAVGDALGTTLEFRRRDERPLVTEMMGGGPFKLNPGEWTDDTSQALCLADSILDCGQLDQSDLIARFYRWAKEGHNSHNGRCFDIGNATRAALMRYKQTGVVQAGDDDPYTAGNGSLMRLAPVAIRWHFDADGAREAALLQSETTHRAADALDACDFFAELLVDAINGLPREQLLASRPRPFAGEIGRIAKGGWRTKSRDEVSSSGYAGHTLEAALWAVHRSATFEEAVILAVNLGDDADTVGAVAGQLAGAIWGASSIPERWLKPLAWRQEIFQRAERLFDASSS